MGFEAIGGDSRVGAVDVDGVLERFGKKEGKGGFATFGGSIEVESARFDAKTTGEGVEALGFFGEKGLDF